MDFFSRLHWKGLYRFNLFFSDGNRGQKYTAMYSKEQLMKFCLSTSLGGGGDGCDSNPCQNGATCTKTDNNGAFNCICVPPFTGKLCDRRGGGAGDLTTTPVPRTTPSKGMLLLKYSFLLGSCAFFRTERTKALFCID